MMLEKMEPEVVALATHPSTWFLECSIHGPLGLADDCNVERVALAHMEDH